MSIISPPDEPVEFQPDDGSAVEQSTDELCAEIEAHHEAGNQVVKGFVLGFDVGQAEDQRAYREGLAAGMARAIEDFSTPPPPPYVAPRFHQVWELHPASPYSRGRRRSRVGAR